jgi:hypothetical protein
MGKRGIWIMWAAFAAAALFGSGPIGTIGRWALVFTLAAHVVEFVVKRPVFERVGGGMGHHFVQTLIYGLFHWRPLEERLAQDDSPRSGES